MRSGVSSSTTRMISLPPHGFWPRACPVSGRVRPWRPGRPAGKSERRSRRPTLLATLIQPWCCCTMPYTVARPRPVPLPTSLVVKNGSKIRGKSLRRNPRPGVLDGRGRHLLAGARFRTVCFGCIRRQCVTTEVLTNRRPPLGMASRALTDRFRMICSIMPGSAKTSGRPEA